MGMRFVYSVLKGVPPARLAELIAEGSKALPGPKTLRSNWGDYPSVPDMRSVSAVAEGDTVTLSPDAWRLATEIARLTGAPHLELRVQEGNHWDFTLYHRGAIIADFSTNVAYWNDDPAAPRPWKKGTARDFADVWGVPLERVKPYLIDWGSLHERRWVCPRGQVQHRTVGPGLRFHPRSGGARLQARCTVTPVHRPLLEDDLSSPAMVAASDPKTLRVDARCLSRCPASYRG